MKSSVVSRPLATLVLGCGLLAGALADAPDARVLARQIDPAQVVPLDKIPQAHRDAVIEVIRDHTFHRKGEPETFPCHPRIYLSLLNEPTLTLALWKDLSPSPVQLRRTGPNSYQGTDGSGSSATWDFVYRSPRLHVLLSNLEYKSPKGNIHLQGRIILVIHTGYYREVNGDQWIQHDVEAFVKVDSRGWKGVARTVRPIIEKLLEDQVREAGWFVSLMGRLVVTYPNWACQVAQNQTELNPAFRDHFRDIVVQTKRPGASTGRPIVAENGKPNSGLKRR
jgi:hypothetical protein